MTLNARPRRAARFAVVAALSGCMAFAPVGGLAYADTKSDLASARAKLEQIGAEVDQISDEIATLTDELTETEHDIDAKQQELTESQQKLSQYVSAEYKDGGSSILQAITGVENLSDMFSRLFYIGKIADSQADAIEEVKTVKAELTAKQQEQEQKLEDAKAKVEDLNEQQAAAAALVSSLDAQLQEELAREAEENAALNAALAASEAPAVQNPVDSNSANSSNSSAGNSNSSNTAPSTGTSGGNGGSNGSNSTNNAPSTAPEPDPEPSQPSTPAPSTPEPSTPSEPSYSASNGSSIVSRAYSKLGTAYVYGACSPDAFDCSGFVSYCLTGSYTRLGTTYTFLGWTQVSNPQPGDVCVSASHCGIYIGNGQMIHASRPGVGVIVGPVQSGMIYVRY